MGKLFISDHNYKTVSVKNHNVSPKRGIRDEDFDFIFIDNSTDEVSGGFNPWSSNSRASLARYDVLFSVGNIPMKMTGADLLNLVERLQHALGTITNR